MQTNREIFKKWGIINIRNFWKKILQNLQKVQQAKDQKYEIDRKDNHKLSEIIAR